MKRLPIILAIGLLAAAFAGDTPTAPRPASEIGRYQIVPARLVYAADGSVSEMATALRLDTATGETVLLSARVTVSNELVGQWHRVAEPIKPTSPVPQTRATH